MSSVQGFYYNGKSSTCHRVTIEVEGDCMRISGESLDLHLPVNTVKLTLGIGSAPASILLPDGGLCELPKDSPIEKIIGTKYGMGFYRILGRWERSIPLALLALVITLAVIGFFIRYAVPAIASHVAFALPHATEVSLGSESLSFLDKYIMKPSALPEKKQREVRDLFNLMKVNLPDARKYRIELRSAGKIGANAFALPGGTIVVTDAMVELANGKNELAGVLAHEAAHERSRHALRQVLQSTGSGLLIAALTGDITSITSLSATLPAALIDAGYSRDFEYEADDAAVNYLKKSGVDPRVYADVLARLQAEHEKASGEKGDPIRWSPMELFSSHPETSERIKRVIGNRNR